MFCASRHCAVPYCATLLFVQCPCSITTLLSNEWLVEASMRSTVDYNVGLSNSGSAKLKASLHYRPDGPTRHDSVTRADWQLSGQPVIAIRQPTANTMEISVTGVATGKLHWCHSQYCQSLSASPFKLLQHIGFVLIGLLYTQVIILSLSPPRLSHWHTALQRLHVIYAVNYQCTVSTTL